MAAANTVGRHAIRTCAEHDHEELSAGIDRIHELGEESATLPVDQREASVVHRDPSPIGLRATEVAGQVDQWGFVAYPDMPDGPGPAFLLVALRPAPTLQHYDPEAVDYWVAEDGRGSRRTLTHDNTMPRSEEFSWGMIRLVDRLGVSNEYLTFGGHLDAALIDDVIVAAFASPAPLLRRGGHSQGWDDGADAIGDFFARMMVAVDHKPSFERTFAAAEPLTRYAAFVRDSDQRRHGQQRSTTFDDSIGHLVRQEATRLRAAAPSGWDAAGVLLDAAVLD